MRWLLSTERGGLPCGALWCFPLDVDAGERAELAALLSQEESGRAARFHSPVHGARFIVAHGRLRQMLAEVLQMPPDCIAFTAGPHGKPLLAGDTAAMDVQFNLSHSDDIGLAGWARSRELGVDVERWRDMRDEAALVRRYFSAAEIAAYEALPPQRRREGFFNCWTRKEAYIKAVGRGLGLALDSFDVSLESGQEARLLRPSALCDDGRHRSLAAPQGPRETSLAVVLEADEIWLRAA